MERKERMERIDRKERMEKETSMLLENQSLRGKLLNMHELALNTTRGLAAMSNELKKIDDPLLAPLKWFINSSFAALTLMISLTSSNNFSTS